MIKHILFDLDGTLYSMKGGMDMFFRKQLREFTSSWLGISWEECEPLWKEAMKYYGTTLEWLVQEKGYTDTEAFFTFVHPENEVDFVPDDPELRGLIESFQVPCSILTNSPIFHAERIIKKLNLEGLFQKVYAMNVSGLGGKPHPSSYQQALDAFSLSPKEMLFIDDLPRYVDGYLKIGGMGLLFDEMDKYKDYPHDRINNLRELINFL